MEEKQNEQINPIPNIENNEENKESYWKYKKKQLIWVGIFLLSVIILEYLTRDYAKQFSMYYFGSTDASRCQYLSYFEFYAFNGRYLLLFLILSYVNVYAALNYMFLDCFVVFLNGIIRFFYLDERPFWYHPEYVPCFCVTDYGNPSTTGIDTFIMFSAFYKAFTFNSKNKVFNYTLWIVCALNIGYIYVIRMMQNVHYINQLLYGLAIGVALYYIVFEVIEIDFGNPKQFMAIVKNWVLISFIIVSVLSLVTFIHINLNLPTPTKEQIAMIEQNCKMNSLFSLDVESYSKSVRIFEFVGSLLGIYLEYILIFKGDEEKFAKYDLISVKDMYKETNAFISFIRLVSFYLVQRYILNMMMLGKANYDLFQKSSLLYGLIVQQSIPLFFHGLLIFFGMKVLLSYVRLSNESIWEKENQENKKDEGGIVEEANKRLLQKDAEN